jgi:general secretion pathway protein K
VDDFKTLLEERPASGWNNVNDFLANSLFAQLTVNNSLKKQLSVSSDFFQLHGLVTFAERLLAVKILFQVKAKKANMIRYQSGGFK